MPDLPAGRRKLLQDRRVVPVDLAPLFPADRWAVAARRHAAALEWLLLGLENARPRDVFDWPQRTLAEATAPLVADLPPHHPFPRRELAPEWPAAEFLRVAK